VGLLCARSQGARNQLGPLQAGCKQGMARGSKLPVHSLPVGSGCLLGNLSRLLIVRLRPWIKEVLLPISRALGNVPWAW
jgi:hypothetical protein